MGAAFACGKETGLDPAVGPLGVSSQTSMRLKSPGRKKSIPAVFSNRKMPANPSEQISLQSLEVGQGRSGTQVYVTLSAKAVDYFGLLQEHPCRAAWKNLGSLCAAWPKRWKAHSWITTGAG